MTAVYSQEQINEIGVLFADEITKQGISLKEFVKQQIEGLEPATPTDPEAGGAAGKDGADGKSAYQVAVDNGFVGTEVEWLISLKGKDGIDGQDGIDGLDGKSAYQVAIDNGFSGTEAEWLASLKGEKGETGSGGGSTGGAASTSLDDGREIKNKLIETDANWTTSHTLHHGLDGSQKVISATFLIEKAGGNYGNEYIPPNKEGSNFYSVNAFDGGWQFNDLGESVSKKGNKLRVFITYLA